MSLQQQQSQMSSSSNSTSSSSSFKSTTVSINVPSGVPPPPPLPLHTQISDVTITNPECLVIDPNTTTNDNLDHDEVDAANNSSGGATVLLINDDDDRPPPFATLIESEKFPAANNRNLKNNTNGGATTTNELLTSSSVVVVTNNPVISSDNQNNTNEYGVVTMTSTTSTTAAATTRSSPFNDLLNNDDEMECDREIGRITDHQEGRVPRETSLSPEPSGNHELVGLIRLGVDNVENDHDGGGIGAGNATTLIQVRGGDDDDDAELICGGGGIIGGVEFQEFDVHEFDGGCSSSSTTIISDKLTTNSERVSSKTVKSSKTSSVSQQQQSFVSSKSSSIQQQSSVEKLECSKKEITNSSSSMVLNSGVGGVIETNGVQQITMTTSSVVEDQAKEDGGTTTATAAAPAEKTKKTKLERKSSKAGGKKNKSNAEISKENISVKSSFSKFDSLVSKNSRQQQQQQQNGTAEDKPSSDNSGKPEQKKLFCASCEKQVFQMELVRAEKLDWHKNCFRCFTCRKVLGVDTYQSHNQRLYCKPHFKELFQPRAVMDDSNEDPLLQNQNDLTVEQQERQQKRSSKLQLIICESQPKELPPDVVRASDAPTTGLEDIQIDVRSKFEMFENFKEKSAAAEKAAGDAAAATTPLSTKRSASVLAKLKKYESSLANGGSEQNGVTDEDLHGIDGIELQSDEEEDNDAADEENSVIKEEIKRKLKNPLQAMNEIAHFKQMDQVRSKWEDGGFTREQIASEQRKEELQKFRSRLCQGKSGQLKELYEKGVEENGGEALSAARQAEMEELKSERARVFRDMFEKGEIVRRPDDDEENDGEGGEKSISNRSGVDLEVFEAGVSRESKRLFEELDKKVISEQQLQQQVGAATKKQKNSASFTNRIKTDKDYEGDESDAVYRDPDVVRSGEVHEDDTLQKSKTTSKMLSVFRQMEENLSRGEGSKDPIIRPLKQFTPPRDTIGSGSGRALNDSEEDEEEEEEEDEEVDDEEEEEEEEQQQDNRTTEDEFLKEVGSLARARSLRAKFERWEQQENERNRQQGGGVQLQVQQNQESSSDDVAESIESAKNLKAKFEAMRLMGDQGAAGDKENKGRSPLPIRVNRFVLHSDARSDGNSSSSSSSVSSSSSTSPQLISGSTTNGSGHHIINNKLQLHNHQLLNHGFSSLPVEVTASTPSSSSIIMSDSEKCAICEKRVYVMEKIEAGGKMYHKNCFRCSQCKSILRMDTFTSNKGTLFCTTHFKQLFKIKGNYDEGFGHETQYQVWAAKKQAAAQQN